MGIDKAKHETRILEDGVQRTCTDSDKFAVLHN
jgi:hypothetical protein